VGELVRKRILIVGDSIALGTGAASAGATFAGRIAADFPGAQVTTAARKGARARDLQAQIAPHAARRWDVVLICISGNDILRFTRLAAFRTALRDGLRAAAVAARLVILATSANPANAPLFFFPLDRLLDRRSRAVRGIMAEESRAARAEIVMFNRDRSRDVFARRPRLAYARDRIHPSALAYAVCYGILKRRTSLARQLS
jgi:lysophospholipase L1-like esterase